MAALTAGAVIQSSLRLLGALAPGEALDATAGALYLEIFNELLDAWSAERLTFFSQARTLFPLTVNKQAYTLGPSAADWSLARPLWIDGAAYLTSTGFEGEIRIYAPDQWRRRQLKGTKGALPEGIHPNLTFPNATIDVWPVPQDASVQIVLYTPVEPLRSLAALTTTISMPEGWPRALRYNLALELGPEVGQVPMDSVFQFAADSKATIKRPNENPDELVVDPALWPSSEAINRITGDIL